MENLNEVELLEICGGDYAAGKSAGLATDRYIRKMVDDFILLCALL
nr:hypothetical protein [uncultured Pedobacter sp.]